MRINTPNWDEYFMLLAQTVCARSKDPNTQVGCVLVDPESKAVRSTGYNGFIIGALETNEMWSRPLKYDFVCHAEMNAVVLAARSGTSTNNCVAYITHFPCLSCFKLLIQAGIFKIVVPTDQISEGFKEEKTKIYHLMKDLPNIEVMAL